MLRLLLLSCLLISHAGLNTYTDAAERIFEGPWNNRRTGASGRMTCNATEQSPGKWNAVFRGVFQGQPFEYTVEFQAKASRAGNELAGMTTIDSHRYQWTGALQANQLRGQYQASNGWNGEFILNETAASRQNDPASVEPESIDDIEIKPVVKDGDHLLFIGNHHMADNGGVYNYFQAALKKRGIEVTHESKIAPGKSLSDMVTREIGDAMMKEDVDVVVITSGDLKVIKQFATKLIGSGKRLVVFMTWEGKHPSNRAALSQSTKSIRNAVRAMREFEKDSGATIIPVAVLQHELTIRPPDQMPRVDYLWQKADDHQNALSTMASALLMVAVLTGESPAGLNFDFPPHIVGQQLSDEPDLRLSREVREILQYRSWAVAQDWAKGRPLPR